MKVFVTGASGFIGTAVMRILREREHDAREMRSRLENGRAVEKELRTFKPKAVIHLAWQGIPDLSAATSAKNLVDGIRFYKLLGKLRISKVIATGTCWQHEEEAHSGNHAPFVAAKNALQILGKDFVENGGGVFVWTYPYFVYGPGKPGRSLVPFLIAEAKAGRAPRAKNSDAWHDFVYVDDVARALVLLAEKNIKSDAYDVGSGKLTRTGDIAALIARIFKMRTPRLRQTNPRGLRADNRPLVKATGWKPRVSMREGIQKMI
ncbi:MAG: NAD-dependent epimerase/dehydratase [Parcubacteria group bacterium GW2011_GWA2_51_10]|nr:MAG: NAD-dependent epimerase/dehydratase [Parcubacteria group bacterium GW2011_GWA2_51_10]